MTEMDIWDADFPATRLSKLVIDRVHGSVRYSKGYYATEEDLERHRRYVSRELSPVSFRLQP